ncbi:MAG TPA: hypothetical protein VG269_02385 [Tepidisphaeraceae bacterium]|jgi:hypothetical protein|nr:hypothetical protein [Tepidisphaeraceae bacterium]
MNPANATSAAGSGTTSSSAPGTNEPGDAPPPDKPSTTLSEAEYLAQQAASAQAAMTDALKEMGKDFARTADPRLWAKTHPWATLASAAVAGFAAAAAVVPSKEQQALNKLAAIERALYAHNGSKAAAQDGKEDGHDEGKNKGGFVAVLLREVFGALRPALMSLISAGMASAAQGAAAPADPNATNQQAGSTASES